MHCESASVLGLMEDLHRLSCGMPSAGTALLSEGGARPFLPYRLAMQVSKNAYRI